MNQEIGASGGQAAGRDIVNVDTIRNTGDVVISLPLAGPAQQKVAEVITDLQRQAIAAKVNNLVELSGRESLDIYRDLLTHFGAERIRLLLKDDFREAQAMLDGWIAQHLPQRTVGIDPASCNEIMSLKNWLSHRPDAATLLLVVGFITGLVVSTQLV